VRARVGERGLGHDEEILGERAEPVGAQPDLRGRLLGTHEQATGAVGGHGPERLQHACALAHAGLTADERDRTRDQPAAEHAVELGDARGSPGCAPRIDLRQGDRA